MLASIMEDDDGDGETGGRGMSDRIGDEERDLLDKLATDARIL